MPGQATVQIGEKQWSVQVATTPTELAQGLSGVASIPAHSGMLFDLGAERTVTVNAYEMLFPLSVVFIGEDLIVTEVTPLIEPEDDVTTVYPCRYFLETNTDEVTGIEAGDQVTIVGYTPTTGSVIELMVTVLIVAMMMQVMAKTMKEAK